MKQVCDARPWHATSLTTMMNLRYYGCYKSQPDLLGVLGGHTAVFATVYDDKDETTMIP
jgi:hypothetical protein